MQTFLPYSSFEHSASILDYRRLGKQRIEAYQILQAIEHETGWRHHPAVKMWKNYSDALKAYSDVIIFEWIDRGYKNNMEIYYMNIDNCELPFWLGNEDFHLSHQSNLVRKLPSHYRPFFPNVPDNLPYIWPGE